MENWSLIFFCFILGEELMVYKFKKIATFLLIVHVYFALMFSDLIIVIIYVKVGLSLTLEFGSLPSVIWVL